MNWSCQLRAAVLVAACLAVACTANERQPATEASPGAAGADPRDQYALVEDIAAAQTGAVADRDRALGRVRKDWGGKRFRWEVALVPALCRDAGACVVMPLDHNKWEGRRQGWLPRLELDDATHRALIDGCAQYERCVFEFEGRLRRFELSSETPTSLRFAEITLHGARAARDDESWVRRRASNPARASARTDGAHENG